MKKIELSKETKKEVISNIQEFFLSEKNEEVSDFQANKVLDFILNDIGPHIYNQAISDAHTFMLDRIEDMYGLEKRSR